MSWGSEQRRRRVEQGVREIRQYDQSLSTGETYCLEVEPVERVGTSYGSRFCCAGPLGALCTKLGSGVT